MIPIVFPKVPEKGASDEEWTKYDKNLQDVITKYINDAIKKASDEVAVVNTSINNVASDLLNYMGLPDYANGDTKTYNTVYQAETNGWLSVICAGYYRNGLQVLIGTTNTPAQVIWQAGDDINSNTKWAGTLIPIPKDYYYKVAPYVIEEWDSVTITFYPTL